MKAIKFLFFLVVGFVFSFATMYKPYGIENKGRVLDYQYLYDNIIRFHFIANSDSDFDQMVKNQIKDEVIYYLKNFKEINNDKVQNMNILREEMDNIKDICENVLDRFSLDYDVNVELSEKYFDERRYGEYIIPKGIYNSFIVYIGEGIGKNFWSILFSSIGFIDSDDSRQIDSMAKVVKGSKNDTFKVSTGSHRNVNSVSISFKVVEVIKEFFQKIF